MAEKVADKAADKAGASGKAEKVERGGGPPRPAAGLGVEHEPAIIALVRRHQRLASWVGGAILLAAAVGLWTVVSKGRKEAAAEEALAAARTQLDAGDLGQGVTAVTRVIDQFRGTTAAHQAVLILNEVRLSQGQAALAAQDLERYVGSALPRFRGQAFRLLGVAQENTGNPRRAAEAYERGAEAARGDAFEGRLWLDAARAHVAAGDSALAVAALERVVADTQSAAAVEARVRLSELTRK